MNNLHQNGSLKLGLSWGDAARDEANQAAVFDELAASAPTSLGGLNVIIAFGLVEGNACSTSDCIKAYVQSFLD